MVRDRTTWSLYGVFVVWGWFLYAFNPAVPLIGDELGVNNAVAGLHGTALAAGTVLAGLANARVVAARGRRGTLYAGTALVVGGVALIVTSGVLAGTLSGAVMVGMGGTLLVNVANAALSEKHGRAGGAAITEANGLGALVGAMAPVALGVAVAAGAGWQPAVVVVFVLLAVVAIMMPPLASPTPRAESSSGTLPGRYWWAWGVLVLLIAVEFSYSVWATTLVAQRTGADTGTATSTLTVLILFLALGRIFGVRLALRVRPGVLLLASVGVTALGWAVLWTATNLPMAMVGMAVSGLGMAFHFPLGVSRSLEASGGLTDIASGRIALGAGLAIGLAPFVLGAVSDAVGVHAAFLLVPLLLGLAGGLLVAGNLSARRPRGSPAPVGSG